MPDLPLGEAVALGAIQGPTELLPVSSSGHLVLVPALLGWRYRDLDAELRKSFEVALHAGGALALLIGLRHEVADYVRSFGPANLATLTAARLLRFRRADANVISRQIALPVILGAAALKGARLARRGVPPEIGRGMAAGAAAAFVSTLLSLRLITMLERSRSLRPYAVYRAALGTGALVALARRNA